MVYISALRVIVDTHSLFMELIANKDTHSGLL